jgi:hypothetical protein
LADAALSIPNYDIGLDSLYEAADLAQTLLEQDHSDSSRRLFYSLSSRIDSLPARLREHIYVRYAMPRLLVKPIIPARVSKLSWSGTGNLMRSIPESDIWVLRMITTMNKIGFHKNIGDKGQFQVALCEMENIYEAQDTF